MCRWKKKRERELQKRERGRNSVSGEETTVVLGGVASAPQHSQEKSLTPAITSQEEGPWIHGNHVRLEGCFEQLSSLNRGAVRYAKVPDVGRRLTESGAFCDVELDR